MRMLALRSSPRPSLASQYSVFRSACYGLVTVTTARYAHLRKTKRNNDYIRFNVGNVESNYNTDAIRRRIEWKYIVNKLSSRSDGKYPSLVAIIGSMRSGSTALRQLIGSTKNSYDLGEVFHTQTETRTNFFGFLRNISQSHPNYVHPAYWKYG